ncbi:MAG: glycosyltransferase family 39 protein [Acidobacteria bacterium]|nr:glycosyltransferase family 39 protein [Acidobacteriota bacterium]
MEGFHDPTAEHKVWSNRYVLLISAAAGLLRLPGIFRGFWNIDEPSWMMLGQAINDGHVLYRDVVDQIPPLTLYVYAWLQRIFGDGNGYAVALFGAFWIAVICWAIGTLAFRTAGTTAGILAATLYGAFSMAFDPDDFLAFNSETIANGLISLSALLAVHATGPGTNTRRAVKFLLTGILLALAVSAKTQASACLLAFLAWRLFKGRRQALPDIGWMLGGTLVVAAGWYAQVAGAGAADHAFHLVFEHQFAFAQVGSLPAGYLALKFFWQTGKIVLCGLPLWAIGLSGLVRVLRRIDRRSEMQLALFWFVFAMLLVPAGGRLYGHYYLLAYPPLALAAGIEASRLAGLRGLGRRVMAFAALFTLGSVIGWTAAAASGSGRLTRFPEESRFLTDRTPPGSNVFVWGYAPQVYLDAARHGWPAFYSNSFLVGAGFGSPGVLLKEAGAWERFTADFQSAESQSRPSNPEFICSREWEQFLREWDANPPAALVDTSPSGYNRMDYPVLNYPQLRERLEGWSGPVRAGAMDFWFPPDRR